MSHIYGDPFALINEHQYTLFSISSLTLSLDPTSAIRENAPRADPILIQDTLALEPTHTLLYISIETSEFFYENYRIIEIESSTLSISVLLEHVQISKRYNLKELDGIATIATKSHYGVFSLYIQN